MKEITVKDILNICKGALICGNENQICGDFSKDTRNIKQGDIYVGIKGENFDGNLFYEDAIKNGATICLLQEDTFLKPIHQTDKDISIITVPNTIQALQQLATYKRSLYDIPVIAITGSVGKTSTKDMIASVVNTQSCAKDTRKL